MAYDAELLELKNLLPTTKNILIALPTAADVDKLAAALALFLSLKQQGKEVIIVCADDMRVGQAHLFGIDHIQKTLPSSGGGGNLTLTLEGVVASDGTVPALEKLDWYPEGANLNLVFHVLPGQTFQPGRIIPHFQGGAFNLILVIGAASLNSLGPIYSQNQNVFSGVHLANIDKDGANTNFGQTNVVNGNCASICEMVASIIPSLGLPLDNDIATNLLSGVFEGSSNLTNPKVNADTYLLISNLVKAGGQRLGTNNVAQAGSGVEPAVSQPVFTQPPSGAFSASNAPSSGFDLSALMPKVPPAPIPSGSVPAQSGPVVEPLSPDTFVTPPVVSSGLSQTPPAAPTPSPEERPAGERVISEGEIEPDWLTPKIFKGGAG